MGILPRGFALVAAMGFCFVMGWTGYYSLKAAQWMAAVQVFAKDNPLVALQANGQAYNLFPYDDLIRRQLNATLMAVMTKHGRDIQIDRSMADLAWHAGASVTPYDTTALLTRIQYLLNHGPFDELPGLLGMMQKVGPTLPHTWMAAAYYHGMTGNLPEARKMALRGLELNPGDSDIRGRLQELARLQ